MVYCLWHHYNRRVCQPVPRVWKKIDFPLPSGQLWELETWGDTHTCNMVESLNVQHFGLCPAITQFAAVLRSWHHFLHPIPVWGWIQGKSLYLPGLADDVMIDILWLVEWRINISFRTLAQALLLMLGLSLSLSPLFLMQAEKWKTGKNWLTFIFIRNGYECSVLSLSPLIHLFIDVDVFCFETHSNIHHHSVFPYPGIALSYSQRKPTLF